ncbi:S-adenosyl-L-methionine-dependent methyltransferase [Trichoderma austrokoningii]
MATEGDKVLAHTDHWDSHYSNSDGEAPVHEWYRSFSELEPFFRENLFGLQGFKAEDNPLILHIGSGDSAIPAELASRGYRRQLCIDFSTVVVKYMAERHSKIEGIEWRHMDVRNMVGIPDKSIDVAFDKGTLDVMMHGSSWNPPREVRENASKYLKEVYRVLKDHGVLLYVTFKQPHFVKPLLNADDMWDIDMQVLRDESSFDYYGFVVKKRLDFSEAVDIGVGEETEVANPN